MPVVAYLTALIGILLLFPAVTSPSQNLKTKTHFYGPFNSTSANLFDVIPRTFIYHRTFHITSDNTRSETAISLFNKSGTIFLESHLDSGMTPKKSLPSTPLYLVMVFTTLHDGNNKSDV